MSRVNIGVLINDLKPDPESPHKLATETEIFGTPHHLIFLRVGINPDTNEQVAYDPDLQEEFLDMCCLYDYAFQTMRIPGCEGDWVCYMHPFGD